MKRGKVLMIVGGGLLVGYLVALFAIMNSFYSGILSWLGGLPLQMYWGFASFGTGNFEGVMLGCLLSASIIMLVTGVCMSLYRRKAAR
jgi:hypothetical protein